MSDKIIVIPTGDKPIKMIYEDRYTIVSEEVYLKAIENFINNIGHLNETIPEGQIWLSDKGWVSIKDEFERYLQQDK